VVKAWQRFIWIGIILGVILTTLLPGGVVQALPAFQTLDPNQRAKLLLDRMTPEEKVGQLFVVTFRGKDVTSKDSKILDLISNRHIGGVVLKAANDNFTNAATILEDIFQMDANLQTDRYNASKNSVRNAFGFVYTPQYIPLFIGASQEGDQYPGDQILSGLTPLPSKMALGATWNTANAEQAGKILGQELSNLGINMLLGPSLDLAEGPGTEGYDDLGVQLFGENPYWVGQMGQAYIRGVHEGSSNRMMVIADTFPGIGGADRPPEQEVATVRKTQDQLTQVDLQPFLAVTGRASSADATTDGLLVANVRYQGWQGTIRPGTRPLSFDAAALDQVMSQPDLSRWRQAGGLLMSDNLGSAALQSYYSATGQTFDPRLVASGAFLGGSDLLYVDNLMAQGDPDSYTTLTHILDFFDQKYRADTAFAQRVDLSVQRILAQKYRMYGDFTLDNAIPNISGLSLIGQSSQKSFDLARQAVTLLHPTQSDLSQVLPRPPVLTERLLFLTDVVNIRQCTQCPIQPALAVDAVQNAVMRLYGPKGGGQINAANLMSYSFLDLKYYLDENKDKVPQAFESNLKLADWVVVSLEDLNPARPESQAFQQLLDKHPELLRNKKVVVFAFNSPYFLDATDISMVSAYYALYSLAAPFVEVAARILFQELTPLGALPVSVNGAGYDLSIALSPDPSQVIPLDVDATSLATTTPQATTATVRPGLTITPTPIIISTVKVGDLLPLKTGVIFDRNHNPVPDGTPVFFIFTIPGNDAGLAQQITAVTVGGIARASYHIQSGGSLEVRVTSGTANSSRQLRLNISSTGQVAITVVIPTQQPSTPTITATMTPMPTFTITPTVTPTPAPPARPGAGEWLLSLLIAWGMGGGCFLLGRNTGSLRWGVRWGLLATAGGLLVYTYLAAGFPGGPDLIEKSGPTSLIWLTLVGTLVGWLIGFAWRQSDHGAAGKYK
jgi:beta-N-acetylhexosaminidase